MQRSIDIHMLSDMRNASPNLPLRAGAAPENTLRATKYHSGLENEHVEHTCFGYVDNVSVYHTTGSRHWVVAPVQNCPGNLLTHGNPQPMGIMQLRTRRCQPGHETATSCCRNIPLETFRTAKQLTISVRAVRHADGPFTAMLPTLSPVVTPVLACPVHPMLSLPAPPTSLLVDANTAAA